MKGGKLQKMPLPKELDERMTINIQSWKKKDLIQRANADRISYSRFLLKIVDEWYERQNGNETRGTED